MPRNPSREGRSRRPDVAKISAATEARAASRRVQIRGVSLNPNGVSEKARNQGPEPSFCFACLHFSAPPSPTPLPWVFSKMSPQYESR